MKHNSHQFHCGLKDGIPIGLGYLAVSFTFGIMARGAGLTTLQSVVMSFTNLTSAGQFAALGIIQAGPLYGNGSGPAHHQPALLSYVLFPVPEAGRRHALLPPFLYVLWSYRRDIRRFRMPARLFKSLLQLWLICVAVPGWTLGTLLGAVSGELLPARLLSALNVALYGMFLAVVIPPAKTSRILTGVILASMALSLVFAHVPLLAGLSSGFKIILLTILIAGAAAILFPVKEENEHES